MQKSQPKPVEIVVPVPKIILPDFHWLASGLTDAQRKVQLEKWVSDQCKELLNENNGSIKAPGGVLERANFVKLLHMIHI